MAFDSDTRNKLAKMVADARTLLREEFTQQLQEIYGIQPDGKISGLDKLAHLDNEQRDAARVLRERASYLAAGMKTEKQPMRSAVDRMTREQSFTVLNRFAALRMCEERGLIQQCVGGGMDAKGFQVYLKIAGTALGGQYDRYRTFIFSVFDEIAVDLGVLFDRFSPFGLLFPREPALVRLFAVINREALKGVWAEDETIGWIYQYFNTAEERRAMRKASSAPRNSRELAVRNQFFTPRYVVAFLTDNTLGRIWYEMRQGDTALKEECRYLVRRPNEVFLELGEDAPEDQEDAADLSQEELLKKPVYIPFRALKDPRDIKMLDPACGSMHFGLYAFDLYEPIYEEAWEIEAQLGAGAFSRSDELKPLHEIYDDKEAFLRDVPRLIIEYNIHGIDIDPRAVQIAALALWLRAQRSWKNLGVKPGDRPRIRKSNVVTAEPMPGDEEMRREFIDGLKPRVLGQLVEVVFDKMALAGEAGSLLKIEEEIKEAVSEAARQWREKPKPEQQDLFPDMVRKRPKQEEFRFDVGEITDEKFWDKAEELILYALKDYSGKIHNDQAIRRRLFVEDAGRGFAFIDLCHKCFDIVLMNPPFGLECPTITETLRKYYEDSYNDMFSCFIHRGLMFKLGGILGAITSRAFLIRRRQSAFRKRLILPQLHLLLDLGNNVMDDAMVQSCAFTLGYKLDTKTSLIFDWRGYSEEERLLSRLDRKKIIFFSIDHARQMPFNRIVYRIPNGIIKLFKKDRVFEPNFGKAKEGMKSFDNFRFLRHCWEVHPGDIGFPNGWVRFAKGGQVSSYRGSIHLVLNRRKEGAELNSVNYRINSSTAQVNQASTYWGLSGCTYSRRSKYFAARILPSKCIFSDKGPAVLATENISSEFVVAWLNSQPVRSFVHFQANASDYLTGIIKTLPFPFLSDNLYRKIEKMGNFFAHDKRENDICSELDTEFSGFCVFNDLITTYKKHETLAQKRISTIQKYENEINNIVLKGYEIDNLNWINEIFEEENEEIFTHHFSDIPIELLSLTHFTNAIFSYLLGIVYGRWDLRHALNQELTPKLHNPLENIPKCQPATLICPDGLPAKSNRIASEGWLRARPDAITLPPEGTVKNPTITDAEYPLRITWNGILVNDAFHEDGQSHPEDIVARTQDVLDLLWKDKAHDIEQEACDILKVKSLRDYFTKPTHFFADHLKRYSKSRRKAPIYWPLSTESNSYTLWIYYHRLTDQTLYTCVNDFVDDKIDEVYKEIEKIHNKLEEASNTKLRESLDAFNIFHQELKDFKNELLRVAKLPYKPNLNDGVLITASPLWQLFRHKPWQKDLKACWEKLEAGDYDWAHLAYTIWPDRVREKCKTDRSLAIAHDLEDICQEEPPKKKTKKRKSK